jgi:hypothetical protein
VLRLTFYAALGEGTLQVRAISFRLCADATLRAHDNSVAATRSKGSWLIARRPFRHFDCGGPVLLFARQTASTPAAVMGPFRMVRAGAALIWGDDELLAVRVPGSCPGPDASYEVSFVDAAAAHERVMNATVAARS